MSKISRRSFIKGLLSAAAAGVILNNIELPESDLSKFTDKELKAISEIKKVSIHDYCPYFRITDENGVEIWSEYVIHKTNDKLEYYQDVRAIKDKYGNILDYYREKQQEYIPDLTSKYYDYAHKDGWLL